jgi:hypothetical protein
LARLASTHRRALLGLAAVGATVGAITGTSPAVADGAVSVTSVAGIPAGLIPEGVAADSVATAGLLGGAAPAAEAPTAAVPAAQAPAAEAATEVPAAVPAAAKLPSYVGALQPNGWYCAPAATRIALSAHAILPPFDDIAAALGTTRNGTASIFEVTRVLNMIYGADRYQSVELAERRATPEQVQKLQADVVRTINEGDAVVANIIGTVYDTAGERHAYNGGHYLTITGYGDSGATVTVTDPADRVGSNEYQVPVGAMADWIAARGYTA